MDDKKSKLVFKFGLKACLSFSKHTGEIGKHTQNNLKETIETT